jgi:hypothetical protein
VYITGLLGHNGNFHKLGVFRRKNPEFHLDLEKCAKYHSL